MNRKSLFRAYKHTFSLLKVFPSFKNMSAVAQREGETCALIYPHWPK